MNSDEPKVGDTLKDSTNVVDHFDDSMSTVSTTTIDTCTTVDTSDFSDVHMRPHSRLSRSNSQVEKRQRLLFRNSRHSLDDEPLPLEDTEIFEEQWEEHQEEMQNRVLLNPVDVPEECEEEDDDDEDDELEGEEGLEEDEVDEEPTTLVETTVPHFSSLSEEISEWASGRDRAKKSQEALRNAIEQLLEGGGKEEKEAVDGALTSSGQHSISGRPQQHETPKTSTCHRSSSTSLEDVQSALAKIKEGLYLATVQVMKNTGPMQGSSFSGSNAFARLDGATVDQSKFPEQSPSQSPENPLRESLS